MGGSGGGDHSPAQRPDKGQPQERQRSAGHSRVSVRDAGPTAHGEGYIDISREGS
jgi:hypothetical protein